MTIHLLHLTFREVSVLAVSGAFLIGVLYLEDRFRPQKTVSSLQFWALIAHREGPRGGRRIRDVSSLLLQLFCFLALLLALAWPEWGSSPLAGRSHLLLLDTSAWTLQSKGQGTILDREKTLALGYIHSLPAADRVMLTRVDGLIVPLTPFTANRTLLRQRLSEAEPSLLALNLREALSFASQAGAFSPSGDADVVYTGPGRMGNTTAIVPEPKNLSALPVEAKPNHCGIRHVGLARTDPMRGNWTMLVFLRNYGTADCDLLLQADLSGVALPARQEHLAPGQNLRAEYNFASTQNEPLTITLAPDDGLVSDHRVTLELPGLAQMRIAVYTSRPEVIRRLVELVPNASISLRNKEDDRADSTHTDLIILDRMSLRVPADVPTLWISPAPEGSPFPVKSRVVDPNRVSWNSSTPVAQGLHREDLPLPVADVYRLVEGDTPVLRVDEGPIVVVRPAHHGRARKAVLGFDPANDKIRDEIAVPLLFMNLVHWLAVEKLAPTRIAIGHAGAGQIEPLEDVQVAGHAAVPLIEQNRQLQFFTARPAAISFFDQGRKEQMYMTLPEIAETAWRPSGWQSEERSSPAFHMRIDLWRWLVLAGITTTLLEWWLFAGAQDRSRS